MKKEPGRKRMKLSEGKGLFRRLIAAAIVAAAVFLAFVLRLAWLQWFQ